MDFKTFFMALSVTERDAFAKRCKTSRAHLTNIAYGNKPCGEKLCIDIERESGGKVRCEFLRSDVDWAYLRGTDCPEPDGEIEAVIVPEAERRAGKGRRGSDTRGAT